MLFVLVAVAVVAVVIIGLVVIGRETTTLRMEARPAVFDLEEAVGFIADQVPEDVAGRITHDDVRWILRTDVDLLEDATADASGEGPEIVDEDAAVARILQRADHDDRGLADSDVAAVLRARNDYLEAIGAIGPRVTGPDDPA